MGDVSVERSVTVAAERSQMWLRLADTDRVNRLLGLDAVEYTRLEDGDATAARYRGRTRMGGFSVDYAEAPYEWFAPERFSVERTFISGPIERLHVACVLAPSGAGTQVTYSMRAEPRSVLVRPIVAMALTRAVEDAMRVSESVARHIVAGGTDPFAMPATPPNHEVLARARKALLASATNASVAERVLAHVAHAADSDVARMRPFELADAWGVPRREVLACFLKAVEAGLVELRWSVLCPSCRGAAESVETLAALSSGGHCHMCDIDISLELDRSVEATFLAHQALRPRVDQVFCQGGPAKTPHVIGQHNVDVGASIDFVVPENERRLQLFARGGERASVIVDDGAPAIVRASFDDASFDPSSLRVAPGGRVVVANEARSPRHVKLERVEYASSAATAHDVATIPEFSAVYGAAILKPKTPLRVSRVAVLFSDLTGSTALYSTVGDAEAFRLVDDHYDVLRDAVAANGGRVLKTMGDAVMASFVDDQACVRGALACLRGFQEFRGRARHGALVDLKLGLFAGSCYVVEANGVLDYFGQTVNVASRLQHAAAPGEIVLPASFVDRLPQGTAVSAIEAVRVKGVDAPIEVVRIRNAPGA